MRELHLPYGRAYAPEAGIIVLEANDAVHVEVKEGERGWRMYRTLHESAYTLIVNRINVYSFDVIAWRSICCDPRLQAVIIVAYRPLTRTNAEHMERHFVNKPLHVVSDIARAMDLARTYTCPQPADPPLVARSLGRTG